MSLVPSQRLTAADLAHWSSYALSDAVRAMDSAFLGRLGRSEAAIRAFFADDHTGYCGVSWGKDSVVVAGMLMEIRPETPLVWVRVHPVDNPDCEAVRDAFLARFSGCNYSEVQTYMEIGPGVRRGTGILESGFRLAAERHGDRHVSGVRGDESAARKLRVMKHGENTARTCAPLAWWSGADVFAYLHMKDLPVHPAYAMSHGGTLDRERIRVASIGGSRGDGMGRREWERRYYAEESAALARGEVPPSTLIVRP